MGFCQDNVYQLLITHFLQTTHICLKHPVLASQAFCNTAEESASSSNWQTGWVLCFFNRMHISSEDKFFVKENYFPLNCNELLRGKTVNRRDFWYIRPSHTHVGAGSRVQRRCLEAMLLWLFRMHLLDRLGTELWTGHTKYTSAKGRHLTAMKK